MRLAAAAVLALVGCSEKKSEPPPRSEPAPASEPAKVESATAPPARGPVGGGRMEHCPTAVPGAETKIAAVGDGVEVTITSPDAKAAGDIRGDARHLQEVAEKAPAAVRHTGEGDGGGGLGKCPILVRDTRIAVAEIEGGVKITLRPVNPEQLGWLVKEVESRAKKAP